MIKICKFGGSSLANSDCFLNVAKIVLSDPNRRYIVVSAPKTLDKFNSKVTDLLYKAHDKIESGTPFKSAIILVMNIFIEIKTKLKLNIDLTKLFDQFNDTYSQNHSVDYLVSRGEFLSATILSSLLNYSFIDSTSIFKFDENNEFNYEYSYFLTRNTLGKLKGAVIPGFYGEDFYGNVKLFNRGGSDFSGSIIAKALNAEVYENFTDVDGVFSVDPKLSDNYKLVEKLSFDSLRSLSQFGANVLYSDSLLPLSNSSTVINIKNTFNPTLSGTLVYNQKLCNTSPLIALSVDDGYSMIEINKYNFNARFNELHKLTKNSSGFFTCVTSGDYLAVVCKNECMSNIYDKWQNIDSSQTIVERDLSLVCLVGNDFQSVLTDILTSLSLNGIKVLYTASRKQDLIIIINGFNKKQAVKIICDFIY